MAREDGEELTLLAVLTALALAQGKDADELGLLAGFLVVVADALALLSVATVGAESAAEAAKQESADKVLEERLARIEKELKALAACCQGTGKK